LSAAARTFERRFFARHIAISVKRRKYWELIKDNNNKKDNNNNNKIFMYWCIKIVSVENIKIAGKKIALLINIYCGI